MKTLSNLLELKDFVEQNPRYPSTMWHRKIKITALGVQIIKKNKLVVNNGTDNQPYWEWTAPIPNRLMAKAFDERCKRRTDTMVEKTRARRALKKPSETKSFLSVLEGLDIRINDHITARVNKKGAVIKREGFSMVVNDPQVFSNIIKLIN